MEIFYQYTIGQINFETLGLLFSLMGVVAGIPSWVILTISQHFS